MQYQLVLRWTLSLLAASMLLGPAQAAIAAEAPVDEVASGAVAVVVEPAPAAAPVEPAATSEAEAPAPEEASSPEEASGSEEAPVAEETAAPAAPASEPQPQPEPEAADARAEGVDTEEAAVPALDSQPVKAATDLVTATGKQLAAAGKEVASAPAPVDAVAAPAQLGAEIESRLTALVDSLESLTLVEALSPSNWTGTESSAHPEGWAGSTAGSAGSASRPGELLPGALAQLPERRLPAAGTDDPQGQGPIATGAIPLLAPSAPAGAGVSPGSSTASSFPAPTLPVLSSAAAGEAQAVAAGAASASRPAGLPSPTRMPFGQLAPGAGSGSGGSIFIPLLGALALLALVVPRGYRRRMAVRDFPVPTPFVCALERPG